MASEATYSEVVVSGPATRNWWPVIEISDFRHLFLDNSGLRDQLLESTGIKSEPPAQNKWSQKGSYSKVMDPESSYMKGLVSEASYLKVVASGASYTKY